MRKLAVSLAALAAAIAAPAFAQTVAITNARILTAGPAGEIAQGTVVVRDGKIVSVGAGAAPAGAQVIDAKGGVVTPGFVAPNALLGAVEVHAVGNDLTVVNPDIGAAFDVQYGLDPASTLIPVARMGGITRAIVTPISAGGGGASFHADDGEE
ncbi:MAG TPA: imidazolonepropionase, partial [Phenylobacterium sp.]